MKNAHDVRKLKVEQTGDGFYKKSIPGIRLKGKWLTAIGFPADSYAEVIPLSSGLMLLRETPNPQKST